MPRLEYFLVARSIVVDRYSGDVSVFGIVEDFSPLQLPAFIRQMVAVSAWELDEAEPEQQLALSVRIRFADGAELSRATPLELSRGRTHSFLHLQDIAIKQAGIVVVELVVADEVKARHSIRIHEPDDSLEDDSTFTYPVDASIAGPVQK